MDTTLQILQKVHLIVTGVPIDGAVRDIFSARVAKEGWGFVVTIVDDYLNALAKTGSVEVVISQLAKQGWGYTVPAADLAFLSNQIKAGNKSFSSTIVDALFGIQTGDLATTLNQRAQAANQFNVLVEAAKKADLDNSPVIQSSLKSILLGITATAKSLDQANQSQSGPRKNCRPNGRGPDDRSGCSRLWGQILHRPNRCRSATPASLCGYAPIIDLPWPM